MVTLVCVLLKACTGCFPNGASYGMLVADSRTEEELQ